MAASLANHLVVDAHGADSFDSLVNAASGEAQDWIESWLRSHPDTPQIELIISGTRNGQIVPLLKVSVSREDWQQQPQVENWLSHFSNTPAILLGFRQPGLPTASTVSSVRTANATPGRSFDGLPLVPDDLTQILSNNPTPIF